MNYVNWISYRYLISGKGQFLTFLNFISIAGVAIGVTALIVVIAVMAGFGNNLREKIIGTTPHIMIEKETGVKDFSNLKEQLENIEGVKGVSPYIQSNIFLETPRQTLGLVLRGIDPVGERFVTKVEQYIVEGSLDDLEGDNIIIGSELARYFGYKLGDEITLISPGSGIAGQGWRFKLKVSGIFRTSMVDYDMNLVITNLKKAQNVFDFSENISSGIGVRIENPYSAEEVQAKIYQAIGYGYLVKTWIDINRNLFEALFLEKWGLFIILTLMVIVASFNIISTLIVTVTSKVYDIGILQSIGVPKSAIRRIFMRQGIFIGTLGTFWGCVGGIFICYVLHHYVKVPEEIYSIDRVPVEIQSFDILVIVVAALAISFLATIYPSVRAAKLEPIEALRYE